MSSKEEPTAVLTQVQERDFQRRKKRRKKKKKGIKFKFKGRCQRQAAAPAITMPNLVQFVSTTSSLFSKARTSSLLSLLITLVLLLALNPAEVQSKPLSPDTPGKMEEDSHINDTDVYNISTSKLPFLKQEALDISHDAPADINASNPFPFPPFQALAMSPKRKPRRRKPHDSEVSVFGPKGSAAINIADNGDEYGDGDFSPNSVHVEEPSSVWKNGPPRKQRKPANASSLAMDPTKLPPPPAREEAKVFGGTFRRGNHVSTFKLN